MYPFDSPPLLHAIVAHFPVALAFLGIPLVYLCAVLNSERDTLRWVATAAYALLLVFAYLAVETGENAQAELPQTLPAEVWDKVDAHQWWAEQVWIFAGLTALFMALSVVKIRAIRITTTGLAMLLSLVTAVWVGFTGHHGGQLVYECALGTPGMEALYKEPSAEPEEPEEPVDPEEPAEPEEPEETDDHLIAPELTDEMEDDGLVPARRAIDPEEAFQISYTEHVEPILSNNCVSCHGVDYLDGGLDLTTYEGVMGEGDKSGPLVIPHDPDASPLVQYIRGELQPQMPRNEPPLSDDDLHVIRMWIAAGAPESVEDQLVDEEESESAEAEE